ncbi:hypothetical protein [Spirosoma gilvum]
MNPIYLVLLSLLSFSSVYAQGKLPKGSVTIPKNMTATFPKNQKFPTVILPCKLHDGKDRPYPCEFAILKLVFYDTNGNKIGEATRTKPAFTLPLSKAKSAPANGVKGLVTYNVRATMTRINPPAFPPKDGYMVRSAFVTVALQSDPLTIHASGVAIPSPANGLIEIPFTASWLYEKSEGVTVGPREFYVENDVTTTKFPFSSAVLMRDKAEVSIVVQPKIDYTK